MDRILVEELLIEEGDRTLVDIAFEIEQSTALIGQSGSGKSLTLKALLGMLPKNLHSSCEKYDDFGKEKVSRLV